MLKEDLYNYCDIFYLFFIFFFWGGGQDSGGGVRVDVNEELKLFRKCKKKLGSIRSGEARLVRVVVNENYYENAK